MRGFYGDRIRSSALFQADRCDNSAELLEIANVVSFSTDELTQELAAPVTRALFVVTGSCQAQLMDDLGR